MDIDKELDDIMQKFRDESADTETFDKKIDQYIVKDIVEKIVENAEGDIRVTIGGSGMIKRVNIAANGNPAGMIMAAYYLITAVAEKYPKITFDDSIEWLKCMEGLRYGPDGSGEGDE